jgi:hypothetical protein
MKLRLEHINKIKNNPSLLDNSSPPVLPEFSGDRLNLAQCYGALYKKLKEHFEKRATLVYVKRGFFSKKWQDEKMDDAEQEKVKKMFDIFFKARYGALPVGVVEEDPSAYKYLETLSNSYKSFPYNNFDYADNGDISKKTVFLVLSVATLFTSTALYYLLSQFLDSMERFYFDENWLKASITLASMAAGAALGTSLGFFVLAPLLTLVGITPIGLGIAATVLSALVIATITTWLANVIQDHFFESTHLNALDPADHKRYDLNQKQIKTLEKNGFNVEVVRCAIVALRKELIDLEAESIPSLVSRLISSTPKIKRINEILKSIRALRDGSYNEDTLKVGDLSFELKEPELDLNEGEALEGSQFNF